MQKLNSGALNRILLFVYILSLSTNAIAQNKNNSKETYLLPPHGNCVYGRVIEKLSKEPMVGVTIRLDGHSTGVITDINGCYVLTLPEKGGLVIYSYIGFETRKIKVTSRQKVDVQMVEATESIQEVIVTGYNSIQKESFTGNTTKIEKEDLLKVNPNNLISAIQTFDPSFRIQENLAAGSDPNSLPQFVLRGQTGIGETTLGQTSTSSISREVLSGNSNLPIFILDGFEVDVEKIYDLDMNSIHSINILKDAAATAMYGSRAANGVIVIERRAPEAGKFRVQYSGVLSAELPDLSSYNLMNAREKLETERLAGLYDSNTPEIDPYTNGYYQRLNNVLTGVDTYWLSQGLRTALNHKHSVFIDGGENDVRWGVELGFRGTEGVMKHSSRKNANAAFYVDYRIGGLQIKNKVTYTYNKSTDVPFNSFSDYSHLLPYMRLYDENGDYVRRLEKFDGASGTQVNPLYEINFYNSFDHSGYDEVTDDLSLNWRITDGLRLRGQFSVLMRNSTGDLYKDPASASYSASTGNINGEKTESTQKRTVIDGSLSLMYNNTFKGHNLNICLSSNMRQTQSTASETRYRGFPGGDLVSSNYAAEVYGKPSSSDNTTRLVGALLTSNYTYNNIYLADLTGRIDGSSEFGSDKRWSMFWSTGAGINIHNYDFMKSNELFSMLKFRVSYGLTGKTNFSLYSAKDMYQLQTDSWYPTGYGVFLYQMGNPNLKWEKAAEWNIGVEGLFLNNRLYTEINYFREKHTDIIGSVDASYGDYTGNFTYQDNMGSVLNHGIEGMFTWSDRINDWSYSVGANFVWSKNKVLKWNQVKHGEEYRYTVGRSTDAMMGLVAEGLFGKDVAINGHAPQTFADYQEGDIAYKDLNGDKIIDGRDVKELGNSFPRTTLGIDFNVSYKGWGLYLQGYSELGVHTWATNAYYWNNGEGKYSKLALDRYHPANNPTGSYPRLTTTAGENNFRNSSFWLKNTSFFRMKNVELSHTFNQFSPSSVVKKMKVFARGANLFVLSSVKDLDPELLNAGVTNYPVTRTFTGGVSFVF